MKVKGNSTFFIMINNHSPRRRVTRHDGVKDTVSMCGEKKLSIQLRVLDTAGDCAHISLLRVPTKRGKGYHHTVQAAQIKMAIILDHLK